MGDVTQLHEFEAISWHLFLNTPEVRKAERIIGRLAILIGVETEVLSLDRYWKDPTMTDARLRSPFGPMADPAEALYAFMLTVKRLARTFSTSGPQIYEEWPTRVARRREPDHCLGLRRQPDHPVR